MTSRRQLIAAAAALPLVVHAKPAERRIVLDLAKAARPLDRFFDHCVGADYPGTTYREDALAQLKTSWKMA
jgi:xylan 1,4-beta-xylosidase